MQLTDNSKIKLMSDNASDVQDGLVTFCNYGQRTIELVIYRGVLDGQEYALHEIITHTASDEAVTDLSELSQFMSGVDYRLYSTHPSEFYDDRSEAMLRLSSLIEEFHHC